MKGEIIVPKRKEDNREHNVLSIEQIRTAQNALRKKIEALESSQLPPDMTGAALGNLTVEWFQIDTEIKTLQHVLGTTLDSIDAKIKKGSEK